MRRARGFSICLTTLLLGSVLSGCTAANVETAAAPVEQPDQLALVEPSTPEDEALLKAFRDGDGPPGFPTGWVMLSVEDIPEELVPSDTLGRNLLGAAIRNTDGGSGESTAGAPPYVKLLFEGGLFVQATADDSVRPDATILADHAGQMTTQDSYSQVQTETVDGTLAVVTVGELPSEWFSAWDPLPLGAAVQWADAEWFYNVWIDDARDAEAVLTVARSMGR